MRRDAALERYRQRYQEKRIYTLGYKAERGCAHCDEHDPIVLDLHHRDRATKSSTRRGSAVDYTWGWKRLLAELAKCDVLCANCHRREEARISGRR